MPVNRYISPYWYAVADYITASIAWGLFFFVRKAVLHEPFTIDQQFWLGVLFIPAGWLILYALIGSYHTIYKKSRLAEVTKTFTSTAIGCTALFFLFLLDDAKTTYSYYFTGYLILFALHFTLTAV